MPSTSHSYICVLCSYPGSCLLYILDRRIRWSSGLPSWEWFVCPLSIHSAFTAGRQSRGSLWHNCDPVRDWQYYVPISTYEN